MDNIIIVGLLTMSAVVAAVLVFETITPSLGISGRSISHAQLDIATRMQTDIEIISVIPNLDPVPPAPATPVCAGGTVGCIVDAWTKNTGGADVSSIGNIDVILRRTDGRWGSRIPYSSNCPSTFTIANTWHRFPCAQDKWPPGDILPIRLNLLADPLTPGIYKISITTPNGVTDDHIFEFSPDGSSIAAIPPPRIVFSSQRDGNDEIYIMNADGSNQTNVTNNSASDMYPSWSPDGKKIAFSRNLKLYVMNADGSDQTRLTNESTGGFIPSWSPDGSKIAFCSYRDGNFEIYVMNADGSNQTRITDNPAIDWYPSWSPDGTKIVFSTSRDGNGEIYVMNADGSNQTRLTNNPDNDDQPSWGPDGKKIAFSSGGEIYVMNADGSNQTNVTNNSASDKDPSWSPDGTKIVFSTVAFSTSRNRSEDIYVINADGSDRTRLTTRSWNKGARWSP